MNTSVCTFLAAAATALFSALPASAATVTFSGGPRGIDPLGNLYSFDGRTFTFTTGIDGFNPFGTLIGSGTGAKSISFTLNGPYTFDPTPAPEIPNVCPPGQYAIYVSLNPLVITCVGMGGGVEETRYDWTYLRTIDTSGPGVAATFNAPVGGELVRGISSFEFLLTLPQPIAVDSFSFTAAWSDVTAVPELGVAPMFVLGLGGILFGARRNKMHLGQVS